jgi:hypothetical protein
MILSLWILFCVACAPLAHARAAATGLSSWQSSSSRTRRAGSPSSPEGLTAFWKLDETTGARADSVGSNTLRPSGTVAVQAGKIGNAVFLDRVVNGATGYLSAADSPALSGTPEGLAVEGWFYLQTVNPGDFYAVVAKWGGAGGREWLVQAEANQLKFYASADGTAFTSVTGPTTLAAGQWYHFRAWHDGGANTINLRVDEDAPASAPFGGPVYNSTTPLTIGRHQDAGNNYLRGLVDAVAFAQKPLAPDASLLPSDPASGDQNTTPGTQSPPGATSVGQTASRAYTYSLVEDFSASGSVRQTSGSISAGSKSLTLSIPLDFRTGQGILVAGAGAGGADLISTVMSASGRSVTLFNQASTTVAGAAVLHDETSAFQLAVNACAANKGCLIDLGESAYNVNGPLQPACNSQVCVPAGYSYTWTLKIRGRFVSRNDETGQPQGGARVISNRVAGSGTFPAFLSVGPWRDTSTGTGTTRVTVIVESVYFTGKTNPTLSVLQLNNAASAQVRDCFFMVGEADPSTQPTNAQATALVMPGVGNRVLNAVERTSVFGYYAGYRASEGARFNDSYAYKCHYAYVIETSNGELSGQIGAAHCVTFVYFEGSAKVDFKLSVERVDDGGAHWYSSQPSADVVVAPGKSARGIIQYNLNIAGTGATTSPLQTNIRLGGNAPMNFINLHTGDSTKWANRP